MVKTIDEMEKEHILNILGFCKGKISGAQGAATLLGVPPSTLHSKMKRLGIQRKYSE
jgi:transcriptional regulator of acetoin/glycerol metabolism